MKHFLAFLLSFVFSVSVLAQEREGTVSPAAASIRGAASAPSGSCSPASTTAGTQEMLGVYDGSGGRTAYISANGTLYLGDGAGNFVSAAYNGANFGFGNNILAPNIRTTSAQVNISDSAISIAPSLPIRWSSTTDWFGGGVWDLYLYRDAANTLAQRNGTNAQKFSVYNTYTSGSNYERLGIQASSNAFFVTPEAATGTVRELVVGAAGSATRLRSSLATPSAPTLADGDWWVECSGTSPARTCSILVRDTGATRTIATSVAF